MSTRSGNSSRSSRHQGRSVATTGAPSPLREHIEQGRYSDEGSDSPTVRDYSMAMVLRPPPPINNEPYNNPSEVDNSVVRDHSGHMVLFNQAPRSHHGSQSHHGPRSHHPLPSPPPSPPPPPPYRPPTPPYQESRASVVSRAPAPHSRSGRNSLLVSGQVHTQRAGSSSLAPGEVYTTMQVQIIFSDESGRSSRHKSRRRSTITSKTPHGDK